MDQRWKNIQMTTKDMKNRYYEKYSKRQAGKKIGKADKMKSKQRKRAMRLETKLQTQKAGKISYICIQESRNRATEHVFKNIITENIPEI